jgi:hypothetical protein
LKSKYGQNARINILSTIYWKCVCLKV